MWLHAESCCCHTRGRSHARQASGLRLLAPAVAHRPELESMQWREVHAGTTCLFLIPHMDVPALVAVPGQLGLQVEHVGPLFAQVLVGYELANEPGQARVATRAVPGQFLRKALCRLGRVQELADHGLDGVVNAAGASGVKRCRQTAALWTPVRTGRYRGPQMRAAVFCTLFFLGVIARGALSVLFEGPLS
jgi:hypothetical protein